MANLLTPTTVMLVMSLSIVILPTSPQSGRASEIVIDNRQSTGGGFVAAPLVAIRPVTTTGGSALLANTRITKDLIIRSATAFPEVANELENLGISDPDAMSMADFVEIIKGSGYPDRYLYDPSSTSTPNVRYPATVSVYGGAILRVWDAKTLTNMVVTGVVDTETPHTATINDEKVEWFKMDNRYENFWYGIHSKSLGLRSNLSPEEINFTFSSIVDDVMEYDSLQKPMLENIGEITFGIPIIYTAEERNLKIPDSIQKAYDVYWADLVVTYRYVNPSDLQEMAFNVVIPEQSVALKLIPLRFGIDVHQRQGVNSPEMSVEYGGAKVSVGEYFSQVVAYTYLKPTIEAYGEGERIFSWRISEEAISGGSHRFAAILGVPKGTPSIDFVFSGHVRLRKSFIGEWYDGELVAGTESWIVPVSF
jgi:hypothetical protein